jgi:PAS domain-containing protein
MARCAHIYTDAPGNVEKNRVGKQCGQFAVNETPFCKFHAGNSQQVIDAARRKRYKAEIAVEVEQDTSTGAPFTELWADDHAMLDPFSLLLWEIRRSGARIEWFDRRLDEIKDQKDYWWGQTKKEVIGASEFEGTNKTYEAKEHVLVKMQNEERKRLQALRDEWQNNRFEAAKIAGYGAFRASTRALIAALVAEFEIDTSDPEIQARLRQALESLPDPIPVLDAPDGKVLDRVGRR